MTTRTFPSGWLDARHIAVNLDNKLVVHREFGEHQEWGSTWTVVFMDEGRYWEVTYQEPNTSEVQADTWFDEENVVATEVRPQPKFVTDWVPVRPHSGGRCKEPIVSGGTVFGACDLAAPFLLAVTQGNKVETWERCVAHAHMLITSPETFHLIEEVRRRWH